MLLITRMLLIMQALQTWADTTLEDSVLRKDSFVDSEVNARVGGGGCDVSVAVVVV